MKPSTTPHPFPTQTCLTISDGKAPPLEYYGHCDYRVLGLSGSSPKQPLPQVGLEILCCSPDAAPETTAFRASIPPGLLAEAESFPPAIRWWVLRLLAAAQEAQVQVQRSRALIALAAVHTGRFPEAKFAAMKQWVSRPCYELLAEMGLPPRPAVLRILGKIETVEDVGEILALASALRRSPRILRLLSMEPTIGREILGLFASRIPLPFITPGILKIARTDPPEARPYPLLGSVLREILTTSAELGITSCPWRYLTSEKSLGRLLSSLDLAAKLCRHGTSRFPSPFPPPEGVRAIETAIEIYQEGQSLHHCLFSHLDDVAVGRKSSFIVSIGSFRGTLLVEAVNLPWANTDLWVRHTLVGYKNSAPPTHAVELIDDWLIGAQSIQEHEYRDARKFAYNWEGQP